MRSIKGLVNIFVLSLFIFSGISFFADTTLAQRYPPGNYKDSCENLIKIGHMLEAKCRKRDGTWQNTALYFGSCNGPIHNDNGNLTCNQGGRDNWLPPGSYKDSCRDMNVNDDTLWARCQSRDGEWRQSSIDFRNCYQDITNDNGRLVCGQRHHHNMLPRGNYKESCRDLSVNGDILSAECKRRDGSWRWTSIDFGDCYGNISNQNGRLECN